MKDYHKTTFRRLILSTFPHQLAEQIYSPEMDNTVYYEAMDKVREENRNNPECGKSSYEHDVILSFFPERARELGYRNMHISIEIKTTASDLYCDRKMQQYLGATDFFFLSVPHELIRDGIKKIRQFQSNIPFVGLIDATNGKIVVMPSPQDGRKDKDRQDRLLACIYSTKKRSDKPEAAYLLHATEIGVSPPLTFVSMGGMQVNKEYSSIVAGLTRNVEMKTQ